MARGEDRVGAVEVHESRPGLRTLVAPERDVRTGRRLDLDRADKGRDQPAPRRHMSPRRARMFAGGFAGVLVLGAGGALLATRGSDDDSISEAADTDPPAVTATTEPPPVVATTVAPSTTSTTTSTTTTLLPTLDPDRVDSYAVTATWTRVEGDAPDEVVVGGVTNFEAPCNDGVCVLGNPSWGWTLVAGDPSFAFDLVTNDEETPTACDPLTITFDGVRADDGSYTGEFVSNPAQYVAPGCSFYGVTQTITLVPSVG